MDLVWEYDRLSSLLEVGLIQDIQLVTEMTSLCAHLEPTHLRSVFISILSKLKEYEGLEHSIASQLVSSTSMEKLLSLLVCYQELNQICKEISQTLTTDSEGTYIDEKQNLGNSLYPLVLHHEPTLAAKITGMLLEGKNNQEILEIISNEEKLMSSIQEAKEVLQQAGFL